MTIDEWIGTENEIGIDIWNKNINTKTNHLMNGLIEFQMAMKN